MFDLNSINSGELARKIKIMPQEVKNTLSAESFEQKLLGIIDQYGLLDELDQGDLLHQLVLILASGLIKPSEFVENIKEFLYLDDERANGISNEILQILKPELDKASLEKPSFIPSSSSADASSEPNLKSTGNKITPPKIARDDNAPAPFIIHERTEVKAQSSVQSKQSSAYETSRPIFIKPRFSSSSEEALSRPTVARVQFGGEPVEPAKDIPPRIVNYSAPKVDVTINSKVRNPEPDIDSSNIIDLKDLPK